MPDTKRERMSVLIVGAPAELVGEIRLLAYAWGYHAYAKELPEGVTARTTIKAAKGRVTITTPLTSAELVGKLVPFDLREALADATASWRTPPGLCAMRKMRKVLDK